ncbi:MAG: NAD(P)-dependent oxidoreductase [Pseudomonadota bacterium]
MPKIVLVEPMHESARRVLEARGDYDVTMLPPKTPPSEMLEACRGAHGIGVRIASLPANMLAEMPNLKVIAKHGVGTDNIDISYCTDHGIRVAITANANKDSVVEQTLMLMLALAKRLVHLDREVRAGNFHVRSRPEFFGVDLRGRTVMVIGVGRIGTALIPMLHALGMKTVACDPLMDQAKADRLGTEKIEDFRAHLHRADLLTVHIPLTPENRNLIGAAELSALPGHAFVINCARGGIVDEAALIAALNADQIAGAASDVFDGEPPPPDHPFFDVDASRLLLAPHAAGNTIECLERMAIDTAENIIAALEDRISADMLFNPEVLAR